MPADWDLKDWLEALSYLAVIVGALSAAALFILRVLRERNEAFARWISRSWSNEFVAEVPMGQVIKLDLRYDEGFVFGEVWRVGEATSWEVSVKIRLGRGTMTIMRLQPRRAVIYGEAKISRAGIGLRWRYKPTIDAVELPQDTYLFREGRA